MALDCTILHINYYIFCLGSLSRALFSIAPFRAFYQAGLSETRLRPSLCEAILQHRQLSAVIAAVAKQATTAAAAAAVMQQQQSTGRVDGVFACTAVASVKHTSSVSCRHVTGTAAAAAHRLTYLQFGLFRWGILRYVFIASVSETECFQNARRSNVTVERVPGVRLAYIT